MKELSAAELELDAPAIVTAYKNLARVGFAEDRGARRSAAGDRG